MSVRMLMLGGSLALLACSAPLRALPASLDPSNPDGPEGVTPPAGVSANAPSAPAPSSSETKGSEPSAPAPVHPEGHGSHDMHGGHQMQQPPNPTEEKPAAGAQAGTDSASSYACPMHSEVVQSSPGRCPKCGMKLMPQTSLAGKKATPTAPAQKKDEGHSGHMHHMDAAPGSHP